MTWIALITALSKYGKGALKGLKWFWSELAVDWFARLVVCVIVLDGVWGWYLYFTKPPKIVTVQTTTQIPGAPVTVTRTVVKFKPYLGGTVNLGEGGDVSVSHFGLCMIPKIGCAYVLGDGFSPSATVRVAYLYRFGLEFGACSRGPLVGVDFQNLIMNATTVSAGICPDIVSGEIFRPYAAAEVAFRY
jgi:hypothetical protein